eukprot:45187_1
MADIGTVLPSLKDEEILKVFHEFDTDHSGDISLDEFETGIKKLKLPLSHRDIVDLLSIADTNKDGKISLPEFKQFVSKQDQKIQQTFISLDINKDRVLSPNELRVALRSQLNLEISNEEMTNFMQQFSKQDPTHILFTEFREKLLLLPAINTRYIYELYKPSLCIDIGEDFTVPSEEHNLCKTPQYSKLNTFISGAICGALSRTATAPADRIKVMFQSGALDSSATIADTISNILNEGGIKSFWRGNGTNVIKIAPESAVKFMSYEILKKNRFICEHPDNPKMYERFIAGGLAGAMAQTAIYPLEIVKTRLALASSGEYNGIIGCLTSIVRKNGVRALFKGWTPSVIGIIPYSGVDLGVYNTIKDYRAEVRHKQYVHQQVEPSALEILLTGSFSSVCGQVVAYPMQVIRTKLQSQGQCINLKLRDGTMISKTCPQFNGMSDCVRCTLLQDGFRGFYKGIMPNFMKSVPAISISYLVFEKTKPLLARFL